MDFFTVPTLRFHVLYCFFIIGHSRRRILHSNVTCRPHAAWIIQQLREAFPYQSSVQFLISDRDSEWLRSPISCAGDGHEAGAHVSRHQKWKFLM
jgi:putative transposase